MREDDELDPRERSQVESLRRRDREVRAHEAAHAAAAGGLGGGASYTYVTGPDGRRYAVGGEVAVRLSSGHTPEEAIRNAQQVRAAALAPAEPSSQDRAVAAHATAMEAAARAELALARMVEASQREALAPTESTPARLPIRRGIDRRARGGINGRAQGRQRPPDGSRSRGDDSTAGARAALVPRGLAAPAQLGRRLRKLRDAVAMYR